MVLSITPLNIYRYDFFFRISGLVDMHLIFVAASPLLADFDFGELFVMADDGAVVVGGVAVVTEALENFHDFSGERDGNPQVMGGVKGVLEVLDVEFYMFLPFINY
jgi:hypothetical protein